MSMRVRPDGCCATVIEPVGLPGEDLLIAKFKALADPTRYEIFRLIAAQHDPICACDVVDRFQVSQPTISHHMRVLSEAGLITVTRRGVWAYYAVDPRGLDQLQQSVQAIEPSLLSKNG